MTMSLDELCNSLGFTHLTSARREQHNLAGFTATLSEHGRPALLAAIAQALPEAKLPERQKIANAVSKQSREANGATSAHSSAALPPPLLPSPPPASEPQRVLFLHGFGVCPDLMHGALTGFKKTFPGCHVTVLAGFQTMDLSHGPTQAAFADPVNDLRRIREWSERTGDSLYAWAKFAEPTDAERREKPRRYYSFHDDAGVHHEYSLHAADIQAAADRVLKHVNDHEEGYDMAFGFSQGGEVLLLLASRADEMTHPVRRPTRIGLFGAELPLVLELAPTMRFSANAVRAFAVMGDVDPTNEGFADAVVTCQRMGLTVESTTWAGGHMLPPAGDQCYAAMKAFLWPQTK